MWISLTTVSKHFTNQQSNNARI
uniref:Uncharacterized protein n=1 Tax=Arundo donax TaxID=35708 RepID=A0A0A8ZBN5_ARUDO